MRDRARAGVDAGFSARPGVPAKSQISWGGLAPGRLGREDARNPGSGHSGYAVFHLPRVVERVPGGAPYRIRDGPLSVALALAEPFANRLAKGFHLGCVAGIGLFQPHTDALGVLDLGAEHVVVHLLPVPAAPARSLAQLFRRFRPHLVEILPAGIEQRDHASGLGGRHRLGLGLGRNPGRTEVGRRIAVHPLDDAEAGRVFWQLEARQLHDPRITGRVRGEVLERGLLVLAGAAPTRPIGGAREGAFGSALDVNPRRFRHQASLSSAVRRAWATGLPKRLGSGLGEAPGSGWVSPRARARAKARARARAKPRAKAKARAMATPMARRCRWDWERQRLLVRGRATRRQEPKVTAGRRGKAKVRSQRRDWSP